VKRVNQILSVLLGVNFIVSSTGVLIYKTHCACTGNEQVSVYVMPETCEKDFHVHHAHNQCGCTVETTENECHECSSHANGCGCTSPEVRFFKLINQITEDDVSYVKVQPVKVSAAFLTVLINLQEKQKKEHVDFYTDPPPKIPTSRNFLIQIHQLKIPFKA
jgi:hypothetical protein